MRFRAEGEVWEVRQQGWLEFDDGVLTGSPEAINALGHACAFGNLGVTPTGPFVKADMGEPLAVYLAARAIFWRPEMSGELPVIELPELPEGAIA